MKSKRLVLFVTLAMAAAPAFAGELSTRAAVGGGLGGALGAFLGSELGGRSGSILGGGLGAAAGSAIATDGYQERYRYYPVQREYRHRGPPGHWKKRRHYDYDD